MQKPLVSMSKEELILIVKSNEITLAENEVILAETEATLVKSKEQITSYKSDVELLKFQLEDLRRQLFGVKRERFISNQSVDQLTLPFDIPETKEETQIIKEKIEYTRKKKKRAEHPGRAAFPSHLPVEETIIEPQENIEGLKCIGQEITEKLEYTPSKFYINRIIRLKYVKDNKEKTASKVLIGSLPEFAIYLLWIHVR